MLTQHDVLEVEEVAAMLRIHKRTVVRLANKGELPAFRVGDQWRFLRQDIEQYIEDQKRKQQRER